MSRPKPDSLLTLTQSFFLNYLQSTRGASSHTVRAYRDALKLFFLFWPARNASQWRTWSSKTYKPKRCSPFWTTLNQSAVTRRSRRTAAWQQAEASCSIFCGKT